jgi:hypothetical protein
MARFLSACRNNRFFYPVLNFDYAEEIARDWNSVARNDAFRKVCNQVSDR